MNSKYESKYNSNNEYQLIYAQHIINTMQLLFFQFVFTFGSVLFVTVLEPLHIFFQTYSYEMIFIPGILTLFITIFMTQISQKMTISQLSLFTMCQTISICSLTTFYGQDIVIAAILFTGGISSALVVYALLTKNNFSHYLGFLFSILTCLIFIGILNIFLRSHILHIFGLCVGTILFFTYIVVDVQYFLTDNMCKESLYHDNLHIVAAVNIYLDVINIFVHLLEIINILNDSNRNSNN